MNELLAHESIDENLRFLILEVGKQLERTREYISSRSPRMLEAIVSRDDYIDNLKSVIQGRVLTMASRIALEDSVHVHILKTVDVVTINLERIADFCGNVVNQIGYIQHERVLEKLDFEPFFTQTMTGMGLVEHALFRRDTQAAIQICRVEVALDELYLKVFNTMLAELQSSSEAQSLVTGIFIAHYFERMGDSLLNIGEAILSACLGEPIKIGQFTALEDSLKAADIRESVHGVSLQAITGTRSGHRIARVSPGQDADRSRMVIFKEGRAKKLRIERDRTEQWNGIFEGLAPKIYNFYEKGDTAAILFEYLPGRTLEDLVLQGERRELDTVLTHLTTTLSSVWESTLKLEPVWPRFGAQLSKRLADLYAVHPDYRDTAVSIGGVRVASLDEMVEKAMLLDEKLRCPFSVFIHGDFNLDNIIFDPVVGRVRFIDLHRSEDMDYVQDVSVFLVSNFRLRVLKTPVRRRINQSVRAFFTFARSFAESHGDETFSARLALGLARSFATSTRFVLDRGLAKQMMHKSRYLLERLLECDPAGLSRFELPEDVLLD